MIDREESMSERNIQWARNAINVWLFLFVMNIW